jgi:hypothetical protein
MSQRNLSQNCWQLGRKRLALQLPEICCNALVKTQTSWLHGDKSGVYGYDPETKAQSSHWKTPGPPRPKKARQIRSKVKVMLTVFFDHEGVIHHEYTPEGQTVNKEYYIDVLCWLHDAVWRKQPALRKRGDWQLHHNNAPPPPPTRPTLSRTSWLNIRFHKCRSPPIHQTWPHVTFFYSQRWKCCWRERGFKTWRR